MILPILDKLCSQRIILASGSPRRKDILEGIGLKIEVMPSTFEENLDPDTFPTLQEFVIETAFQKAVEVAQRLQNAGESAAELIISADTIVALDGKVYGKPGSDDVARDMLNKLSGKSHDVLTGVTLLWKGYSPSSDKGNNSFVDKFCEITYVHMGNLNDDIISSYIQTQEPIDKAGAYGIQGIGGSLVEKINGDFYNVAGFPLHRFCQHVNKHYGA